MKPAHLFKFLEDRSGVFTTGAMVALSVFWLAFSSAHAQTWSRVFDQPVDDVEGLGADALGHIYAGTDGGVYVTSDSGKNWDPMNLGLTELEVFSFTVTPKNTVLAGTEGGGIFRSTDFGAHWAAVNTGLPDSSNIISLVCDRSGNIFAGHSKQGVFFSDDDGISWQPRDTGIEVSTIWSMTIAPTGTIFAGATGAILHSNDLGLHWIVDSIGSKDEVLAFGADSSGNVFAGVNTGGSYRSGNLGLTWEPFELYPISAPVRAFACDGHHLYAATWGLGIFESIDTGKDWTVINNGLNSLSIYTMISAPDGNLYAGTSLLGQSEAEVYQLQNTPSTVTHLSVDPLSIEASPNPFSSQTKLCISLSSSQMVRLDLCDGVGRIVRTIWDGFLNNGEHEFNIDGKDIESGTYFARLEYQGGESLIPLILTH